MLQITVEPVGLGVYPGVPPVGDTVEGEDDDFPLAGLVYRRLELLQGALRLAIEGLRQQQGMVAAKIYCGCTTRACPAVAAPLEDLDKILRDEHRETPAASGDMRNGRVLIYTARDGSTWTVLVVSPTGRACVAADGRAWREFTRGGI